MAVVPFSLVEKWMGQSDAYGSGAEPTQTVYLRTGRFNRGYRPWAGPPIAATIIGGNNSNPWQAWWTPSSDWVEVPGVFEVKLEQGFDNNGLQIATVQLENVLWTDIGGLIHVLQRGYFSPLRGYDAPGRPGSGHTPNEWFGMLKRNSQIMVVQGYDDDNVKTFTGLIDDVDVDSAPDHISVTSRDFGQALVDQGFFAYNHDPAIREPITFVDREWQTTKEGYAAKAATEAAHHPASYVTDQDKNTSWLSRMYTTPEATDWIEVHLPQGNYSSFYFWPRYAGMHAYVSVFVRPRTDGHACRFNGEIVPDNQWLDVGLGDVPGANGGYPFIREMERLDDRGRYYRFGVSGPTMQVGPGSVLRIALRELQPVTEDDAPAGEPTRIGYRAGARRLCATRRLHIEASDADRDAHHIAIDDVADAVKVILRWAGFQEWDIESTGVRIKKPVVFNRGDKFIDAINKLAESTNYVFFMKEPSSLSDLSIGVPCFRNARITTDDAPIAEVRDSDLITGIQAKFSDEPLADSIRVRGRALTGKNRRVRFTFFPPWSGHNVGAGQTDQLAGMLKQVVHADNKLTTAEDCEFACYYIALREAIESAKATVQIPAMPGFELDTFASLVDEGTGTNTRLWIAARTSTFSVQEDAKTWVQALSGSLVDIPEVVDMKRIIKKAIDEASNE